MKVKFQKIYFFITLITFTFASWGSDQIAEISQPIDPNQCTSFYDGIFSDNRLDILILYGYKDSRPSRFVADRLERMQIVHKLTSTCGFGEFVLCNFQRTEDDGDHFYRNLPRAGLPPLSIQLDIIASSAGADDKDNRSNTFQNWITSYAETVYQKGFSRYELLFYNGHSRAGGGPDFSPPEVLSNKQVNYGFYKRQRPGLKRTLSSLENQEKTKVFGMFSCASSKYFTEKISEKNSNIGLISSPYLLYHTDANANMLAALKGFISKKCPEEINIKMKANRYPVGSELSLPTLTSKLQTED